MKENFLDNIAEAEGQDFEESLRNQNFSKTRLMNCWRRQPQMPRIMIIIIIIIIIQNVL